MTGSGKFWTWALTALLTVGIVVFINLGIDFLTAQWDLTEDNRYTLPPAAKKIAERLEDVCTVKCYVTTDLPNALSHVPRVLRTRLEEFRTASGNRLEFRFIDPEEEGEGFKEELASRGLKANRIPHVDEGKQVVGDYYLALEFTYLDQEERLDLIQTIGRAILFESEMLRGLPYAICTKLVKMMNPEPKLGLVADKKIAPKELQAPKGPFPAEASDSLTGLRGAIASNLAAPKEVTIDKGTAIPEDLEAILVYRPDGLSERSVFELDQALMKGKNIAIILDNHATVEVDRFMTDYWPGVQPGRGTGRIKVREIDSGMSDWLAHFGVNVEKGYLESLHCGIRLVPTQTIVNGRFAIVQQQVKCPPVVVVSERDKDGKTGQFSDDNPSFSGIGQVSVFAPAPLSVDGTAMSNHTSAEQEVVLSTAPDSWIRETQGGWINLWEQKNAETPTARRSFPLVVSVRGSFKSFFAGKTFGKDGAFDRPPLKAPDGSDRAAGPNEEPRIDASVEPGQLWVFADADFCNDNYLMQRFGLAVATQSQQAQQLAPRMVFGLMNVVNNLTAGGELVEIRKPALTDRSMDAERIEEDKGTIRFMAVWLMPLIVVGFGLVWWVLRSVMTHVPSPSLDAGHQVFVPIDQPVKAPEAPAFDPAAYAPADPTGDDTTEDPKPQEPQS